MVSMKPALVMVVRQTVRELGVLGRRALPRVGVAHRLGLLRLNKTPPTEVKHANTDRANLLAVIVINKRVHVRH